MKDRYGFTYEERLATQEFQLMKWSALLLPEVHASTVEVLEAVNAPATDPNGLHNVPLGSHLASLILSYPEHQKILERALLGEPLPCLCPVVHPDGPKP